jgi:hypothetical protein
MYCQRASSGFATMVCSATGTVPKIWPAAENFSVFRLLWHHHHRTIASATDNSRDRICSNARSVRKVRCGGSVFSRRALQPPDGTVHEAMLPAMPVLTEASCRPGLRRSLSPPGFDSASSVYIAPQVPSSSASHTAKHILHHFSQLHSLPSRHFLGFLSNTVTFQNT